MDTLRCCTTCGAVYRKDYARCANDGLELVETETDPLVGAEVGAYVVAELLGEGAMGRVYRAYHRHLVHKQFALKVLLGDVAMTQSMRLRFTKEAESASQLVHPNIVGVVDFGRSEKGLMFLAMELVEGVALGDVLFKRPMAPARVARLARQLALGLEHAHAMGIIHRDFKPDNIMVVGEGDAEVARIADFGLAISIDQSDARLTETGFVMGTAGYIAPEQCTGRPIDHRADLYALGASMFEMVTGGVLPFAGLAPEVIAAKTTRSAPSIEERCPGLVVPPALATVIARLLARRPDQRYADARAVVEALEALEALEAPAARVRVDDTVVAVPTAAMRHGRRRRWTVVVAAAIGLVAVAAGAWWIAGRGANEPAIVDPIATVEPEPAQATPRTEVASPVAVAPAADPKAPVARAHEHADPEAPVALAHEHADTKAPVAVTAYVRREKARARTTPRGQASPASALRPVDAPIAPAAPVQPPAIADVRKPDVQAEPAQERHPARIAGFAVDGSLPATVVRRALDRVAPALRACSSTGVETVEVQFSIGESRRASAARAQRGSPAAGCVVAALSAVRTDAAPDVGDAAVRVRVEFVEQR